MNEPTQSEKRDILDPVDLRWVREHPIQALELIDLLRTEVGLARCDLAAYKSGFYKLQQPGERVVERVVERQVPVYEPDAPTQALIDAALAWAEADQRWEKREYQYQHAVACHELGRLVDEEVVQREARAAERAARALRKAILAWREEHA